MRRFRFCSSTLGTMLLAAVSLGACADNDSGMFVRGVLALQAPDCEAVADPTSPHWFEGVYDLAVRSELGYSAVLLVGNQLVPRGSPDQLRTETSRVVIEGAEVALLSESGATITEFTVPSSGFVDPGSGEDPGYGAMSALLIPPGQATDDRVIAEVRAFGTTLGGDEIESAAFTFPITVCTGCLITVPSLDAVDENGMCTAASSAELPEQTCRPGQDEPVDCRYVPTYDTGLRPATTPTP
jgi:hypothetical protein